MDESGTKAVFATTHWSVVLAAGDTADSGSQAALAHLCQTYWYPLYAYAGRRGHDAENARDLTQGFFEQFDSDARLKAGPAGVAVASAGNVYVADSGNNTIRKGYPEDVPVVIVTSGPGFGFNGGQFGFSLTGPAGRLVVVEASADLVSWLPLWTNTFTRALSCNDPESGVYSNRFYRAHLP